MNKNINELIEELKLNFQFIDVDYPDSTQVSIDLNENEVHSALSYLKAKGWIQLSLLTCVDWIEENKFQLVYSIFNWENGVRVQIRTKIDRNEAVFRTITNIYPGAKYYERDTHEFFGVKFLGNPDSTKHLFLENWDDIPPMRKDFDPEAYSNKKYGTRKYETNFNTKVGETV